jgi:hypothetical protein
MLIDEEFTLKKLQMFLAFMRSGNLGRAAAELDTSHVSVHRAIHSLESAYVLEERARKLIQEVDGIVTVGVMIGRSFLSGVWLEERGMAYPLRSDTLLSTGLPDPLGLEEKP